MDRVVTVTMVGNPDDTDIVELRVKLESERGLPAREIIFRMPREEVVIMTLMELMDMMIEAVGKAEERRETWN